MKRILLLIAISVIAFKTQAQTEAGKFVLGGGAGLNSYTGNNSQGKGTSFSISPQVGYFVQKNLAIGAGIGYQFQWDKQENNIGGIAATSKIKAQLFTITPFARYYTNITEQFRFFTQLSVPLIFGDTKTAANSDDYVKQATSRYIGASLSPGFAFFPGGRKISFEFSISGISYIHNSTTYEPSSPNYTFGSKVSNNQFSIIGNSLSPNIGIYFYL